MNFIFKWHNFLVVFALAAQMNFASNSNDNIDEDCFLLRHMPSEVIDYILDLHGKDCNAYLMECLEHSSPSKAQKSFEYACTAFKKANKDFTKLALVNTDFYGLVKNTEYYKLMYNLYEKIKGLDKVKGYNDFPDLRANNFKPALRIYNNFIWREPKWLFLGALSGFLDERQSKKIFIKTIRLINENEYSTLFFSAIYFENIQLLRCLIEDERLISLSRYNEFINQAFKIAMDFNYREGIDLLYPIVKAGTFSLDLSVSDAVQKGRKFEIADLISGGKNLFGENNKGENILHIAIKNGHILTAQGIIKYYPSLLVWKDRLNQYPLHGIRYIVPGKVTAGTMLGFLQAIKKHVDKDTFKFLLEEKWNGQNLVHILMQHSSFAKTEIFEWLHANGIDLNILTDGKENLTHFITEQTDANTIKILYDLGLDFKASDKDGFDTLSRLLKEYKLLEKHIFSEPRVSDWFDSLLRLTIYRDTLEETNRRQANNERYEALKYIFSQYGFLKK